jgi:hypothetical protein
MWRRPRAEPLGVSSAAGAGSRGRSVFDQAGVEGLFPVKDTWQIESLLVEAFSP